MLPTGNVGALVVVALADVDVPVVDVPVVEVPVVDVPVVEVPVVDVPVVEVPVVEVAVADVVVTGATAVSVAEMAWKPGIVASPTIWAPEPNWGLLTVTSLSSAWPELAMVTSRDALSPLLK
jgi:hypothetical protein